LSPLPPQLRGPANSIVGSADVHRLYVLGQKMPAAHGFLLAHVPAGMRRDGTGRQGGPAGVTMTFISYTPLSLPRGVSQAELAATIVPRPGGSSLLRADAQVRWFPPRTPAEHLDPPRLQSVRVSATILPASASRRQQTVSRVFTSPTVLARLARLLNGLPAAPRPSVMSCPAITVTYHLRFAAKARMAPSVLATTSSCATDGITVIGQAQPALWDPGNKLAAAAGRLLHLDH